MLGMTQMERLYDEASVELNDWREQEHKRNRVALPALPETIPSVVKGVTVGVIASVVLRILTGTK